MGFYYYLQTEENDEDFSSTMSAFGIEFKKVSVVIFDKKYSFVEVNRRQIPHDFFKFNVSPFYNF